MSTASRRVDRAAIGEAVTLFLPAIPFGFVLGVAFTESRMPTAVAWSTSPLVFAGAAQLATVTLAGIASVWAVVAAGFVINARHVMYSAALAPAFRTQPRWFRWVGPYFLVDQIFAIAALRTGDEPEDFRRFYLTTSLVFAVGWNLVTAIGLVVGPSVPSSWRLDFAPAVMFAGLTIVAVNRRPAAVAALVGGGAGLLSVGLRDRLGILVGAVAGVIAGTIAEDRGSPERDTGDRRQRRR